MLLIAILFGLVWFSANLKNTNAQMMMPFGSSVSLEIYNHTAQEEIEGQTIYSNLITGQVNTNQLTDDDLGKIGEYFMGRMVGNTQRHARMNQMMINMMGENGEEAVHIDMGRRYIGSVGSYMMGGCR